MFIGHFAVGLASKRVALVSRAELDRLAEFNRFYEQRERQLPSSEGTVRTWLASPLWREIMKKAAETLAQIRP